MATKGKSKAKAKAKPTKTAPQAKAKQTIKPVAKTSVAMAAVITPLEDRVIIAVAKADEKTAGGIFIPGNITETPQRGRVVAAGPGRRNKKGRVRPLDVKSGDEVLFAQYTGTKIQVGASEFLIVREEDLLGIVT